MHEVSQVYSVQSASKSSSLISSLYHIDEFPFQQVRKGKMMLIGCYLKTLSLHVGDQIGWGICLSVINQPIDVVTNNFCQFGSMDMNKAIDSHADRLVHVF